MCMMFTHFTSHSFFWSFKTIRLQNDSVEMPKYANIYWQKTQKRETDSIETHKLMQIELVTLKWKPIDILIHNLSSVCFSTQQNQRKQFLRILYFSILCLLALLNMVLFPYETKCTQ